MQDVTSTLGSGVYEKPVRSALRDALRRARAEAAEQADAVIELREAERARLEALRDALAPVIADASEASDLFDVGITAGERPRLFIDMVAFVEMAHDRRTYRFQRDGRNGRRLVAENEKVEPMVQAVTDYVARRLVERERLLAEDGVPKPLSEPAPIEPAPPAVEVKRTPRWARWLALLVAFGFGGGVGAAVVVGLMIAAMKGKLPISF